VKKIEYVSAIQRMFYLTSSCSEFKYFMEKLQILGPSREIQDTDTIILRCSDCLLRNVCAVEVL